MEKLEIIEKDLKRIADDIKAIDVKILKLKNEMI